MGDPHNRHARLKENAMKTFPMFLRMEDRTVVIVGGGEQAAQKCRLILKTEARIVVAADALEDELAALHDAGRIMWHRESINPALFADTVLVFVATGCPGADAALHALAREAGALVNVVDAPELCDAITPSIVDRDPVVIAIGTEGTAPVLARQIKTRMEEILEPRLGDFAALSGRLRGAVARQVPRPARRDFWRWVFNGTPRQTHARGAEREAAEMLKSAIANKGALPERSDGAVSLVGAGAGRRDLITLRGVQRLQEADIIFHDRLIDAGVLEYARRDAERVCVGKAPGVHPWPQDRINDLLVSVARQGKRVVRLKCGDPGVFARGGEEIDALAAAGIPCEIVPGVTAACVAAASIGGVLTERGKTDTLVLSTGICRPGDTPPDISRYMQSGTTLALYMSVQAAPTIQRDLLLAGHSPSTRVDIIANADRADMQTIETTLGDLSEAIATKTVANPAIILIRSHKSRQQISKVDAAA